MSCLSSDLRIWLCTLCVFDCFLETSRSRSSMFMKSMLPPKFSWYVRLRSTPRSSNSFVRMRCTIVAPTCDLMSSPTMGSPASANRLAHSGSLAMNTGMQFTNPASARIAACA